MLVEHLLHECEIVGKILAAEKQSTLSTDRNKVMSVRMYHCFLLFAYFCSPLTLRHIHSFMCLCMYVFVHVCGEFDSDPCNMI